MTLALQHCSNGRMKRCLCGRFCQQNLDVLRKILHRAQVVEGDAETRNKTFQVIVFGVLAEVKRENTEGADFPQAPKV